MDLVTFTEEILNGKLHFLCSEYCFEWNLSSAICYSYHMMYSYLCRGLQVFKFLHNNPSLKEYRAGTSFVSFVLFHRARPFVLFKEKSNQGNEKQEKVFSRA